MKHAGSNIDHANYYKNDNDVADDNVDSLCRKERIGKGDCANLKLVSKHMAALVFADLIVTSLLLFCYYHHSYHSYHNIVVIS